MTKLLDRRIKEHDISMPHFQMVYDNVAIHRINRDTVNKTAGGLYTPSVAQENRGVLLSAGLKALDILFAAGIEIGHIVHWGQWVGTEKQLRDSGAYKGEVLILKAHDITASEDLLSDINEGRIAIEREDNSEDPEYGEHFITTIRGAA